MSSGKNKENKVRVVILGAGYSGTAIVGVLGKYFNLLDLMIVERREYKLHYVGGHLAAVGEKWIDAVLFPLGKLKLKVRVVYGAIKSVMSDEKKMVAVSQDENHKVKLN